MMTMPTNLDELVVEFFNRASMNDELSERMSFAQTTVHIHFTDVDHSGCTIYLDRTPISAEMGIVGDAEVELFASASMFAALLQGREQLPIAIVRGDVSYTGPVRKFLRVVPILSSFDFEMFKAEVASADPGARNLEPAPWNDEPRSEPAS